VRLTADVTAKVPELLARVDLYGQYSEVVVVDLDKASKPP